MHLYNFHQFKIATWCLQMMFNSAEELSRFGLMREFAKAPRSVVDTGEVHVCSRKRHCPIRGTVKQAVFKCVLMHAGMLYLVFVHSSCRSTSMFASKPWCDGTGWLHLCQAMPHVNKELPCQNIAGHQMCRLCRIKVLPRSQSTHACVDGCVGTKAHSHPASIFSTTHQ